MISSLLDVALAQHMVFHRSHEVQGRIMTFLSPLVCPILFTSNTMNFIPLTAKDTMMSSCFV